MDDNELMQKIAELGLEKIATRHSTDLQKALANGKALSAQLPSDLHWTEEPAHVFRSASPSRGQA